MEDVPETDLEARTDTDLPRKLSLNQASADELETLPGIGPVLAQRIVVYRSEHGPFWQAEDLMQVPGVGPSLLARIVDQITVTQDGAIPLPPPVEAAPPDVTPALGSMDLALPPALPAPEPEEAEPAPPPLPSPLEADEAEEPEPVAAPEGAEPVQRQRAGLHWVWSVLLGGILGACLGTGLTLFVLYSINGSLDVGASRAFVTQQLAVEALDGRVETLRRDVQGIRQQVEVLSGLTARVEQAESQIGTLRTQTEALAGSLATLEGQVAELSADLRQLSSAFEQVRTQMETTQNFFRRLQGLLDELFGASQEDVPNSGYLWQRGEVGV